MLTAKLRKSLEIKAMSTKDEKDVYNHWVSESMKSSELVTPYIFLLRF